MTMMIICLQLCHLGKAQQEWLISAPPGIAEEAWLVCGGSVFKMAPSQEQHIGAGWGWRPPLSSMWAAPHGCLASS